MVGTDVAPSGTGTHAAQLSALGSDAGAISGAVAGTRRRFRHAIPIVVAVVALAIVGSLSFTAAALHDSNENRLLRQRVNEAGAVIAATIPNAESPLASGAILAEATHGERASFTKLLGPLSTGTPFVSASLWPAHAVDPKPLIVLGDAPELASRTPAGIRTFLAQATVKSSLALLDLLNSSERRLGYSYSVGPQAKYVVYAEAARPPNRRAAVDSNSAFSNLDYTIYLGTGRDPRQVIASSSSGPKLTGRTASDTLPFGDSNLLIVMTPRGELGGSLLARLPWLIGGLGIVLALAAALLTERLVLGRARAEELATLTARLFSEQRSVAQTLQQSLLPEKSPEVEGLGLAVRYMPGAAGVDIGGDWYDLIDVGPGQVMLVVGDVSGRGLRAATVMASLRYAIRAYAAEGDGPSEILIKMSKLISVGRDGHFATVLCGLVDVAERRITFANAGHPNPLLITGAGAEFVATKVGVPVGVEPGAYPTMSVSVPSDGVLLAYTDGIFERRGESPDVGLERLRNASVGYASLDELLDGLLRVLTPDGGRDDTAILAVTWRP